tara:strand:+ start:269 stop:628 length:360 start_codon:yes stop_codon:yes gene_type:complete
MLTVHYVIHSFGLIPEVELFLDEDSAKEYWISAFGDLQKDYDGKTPKESFEVGFAHWHEYEMRLGTHTFDESNLIILKHLQDTVLIQRLGKSTSELVSKISNDQHLGKEIREMNRRLNK